MSSAEEEEKLSRSLTVRAVMNAERQTPPKRPKPALPDTDDVPNRRDPTRKFPLDKTKGLLFADTGSGSVAVLRLVPWVRVASEERRVSSWVWVR